MRGRDLPTSRQAIKVIVQIIAGKKQGKNNFYELGCGRGGVATAVKKNFPELTVFGLEKNGLQIFFAKLKSFFLGQKITLRKIDLFKADLENADIVYIYLERELMSKIEKKLKNELKGGSVIITNTTSFPNWPPKEIYIVHPKSPNFEKLFVYAKD